MQHYIGQAAVVSCTSELMEISSELLYKSNRPQVFMVYQVDVYENRLHKHVYTEFPKHK